VTNKAQAAARARLIAALEREYGMSFLDILHAYASDGESRTSTAAILGLSYGVMETWHARSVAKGHPIPWPKLGQSNAFKEARLAINATEAQKAARRSNMRIALYASLEKRKKVTECA